ncbi:MDR family MFS transporter [Streptomyces sp. NBC_00162]|uniref:MDR family MFS transporter n=2 Tax=unclassified Streptomyces TaxID=2593676 RepID=UPI00214BD439|nr:MDR family MFS transporter [Streptomyces sp. NBC_00162]UUU44967.1 MFS transporter [Streptomyces sp. NBC_00162]
MVDTANSAGTSKGVPPEGSKPRSVGVVLVAVMIAMLLASLDTMITSTAIPTIVGELGGLEHLSWVVTIYTLATVASTPLWGKAGDLYGRKGTFLTSVVIFLIGSALCGAAQDMGQLIAFRAIQGLGGGGLLVGAMAIIGSLIPPREVGKYQGLMAAVSALSMIGGPLIGGAITDHLGWRWAFYINLPLAAVALAMVSVVLHLPKNTQAARPKVDYPGAALLTTAITSTVLVTTWGGTEYAWASGQIIALITVSVLSTAAFLYVETKAAEPILPLHVFRNRNFSLIALIGFLVGFVTVGGVFYLPLFLQTVQGASATNSGLLLLPLLGSMLTVSMITGRITSNTGKYKIFLVVGGALVVAGLFLLATMDTSTPRLVSGLYMAVLGAGIGFLMQITMLVAQNSVELKDMGVASSTTALGRTLGGAFGVALMGTLFTTQVTDAMTDRLGPQAGALSSAQLDAASLATLPEAVREAYRYAVAVGTHWAFLICAAIAVLGFAAALFIKEVPLRGTPTPNESQDSKTAPAQQEPVTA